MSEQTLHQILLKLGAIEEGQNQLRQDFDKEGERSRDSRKALHDKVDEHISRISHMESTIVIAGETTAQMRNELDALTNKIENEIMPSVKDMDRLTSVGKTFVGVIAIGGASFGASLVWWGEQVKTGLQHLFNWLIGQ